MMREKFTHTHRYAHTHTRKLRYVPGSSLQGGLKHSMVGLHGLRGEGDDGKGMRVTGYRKPARRQLKHLRATH